MTRKRSLAALAVALLAVAAALTPAPACAPAPGPGQHVEIADEAALIVWDAATKTEHFIRRATFHSTSTDFGFLVPTPTQPSLGEVDEAVFANLSSYTAPKIEHRTVRKPRPRHRDEDARSMPGSAAGMGGGPPRGVEVLDQGEFGGQEAVVLKFHRGGGDDTFADAKELADWLKKRGYEFGPQLVDWLKPYIANDWIMTAFRIAKRVPVASGRLPGPSAIQELVGKPVRMSFKTDRPFYPYREPVAAKPKEKEPAPYYWEPQRFLRVFFIATERIDATLGTGSDPWVAKTAWANALSADQSKSVAESLKLPGGLPATPLWLTEFEDRSSPRKGTDEVYFQPSADQSTVARPTVFVDIVEWYDEPEPTVAQQEAASEERILIVGAAAGGVLLIGLFLGLIHWLFVGRK